LGTESVQGTWGRSAVEMHVGSLVYAVKEMPEPRTPMPKNEHHHDTVDWSKP